MRTLPPLLLTRLAALMVASAGLVAGAGPPDLPAWEVRGAAGPAERVAALQSLAAEARRDAFVEVPRRLGVQPGAAPSRWVLDLSPPRGRDGGSVFLGAGTTGLDGDGAVVVEIAAARFLSRPGDLRTAIVHEAAHAILASRAGSRDRYLRIPWWFREGVALLAAGEGLQRVEELVAYLTFRGRASDGFLVGIPLDDPRARSLSPAEAWLAVDWIESRLGAAGLRDLCLAACRGEPLDRALSDRLGPSDRTRAWMLAGAMERVAEILPRERERMFRKAMETARRDGPAAAIGAWRDLLRSDPRGCLAPTLRYLLGRELSSGAPGSAELREASAHLRDLLDGPGTLWRAESLVLLGECLARDGDSAASRRLWEEALHAFPDDEVPAARARANLGVVQEPRESGTLREAPHAGERRRRRPAPDPARPLKRAVPGARRRGTAADGPTIYPRGQPADRMFVFGVRRAALGTCSRSQVLPASGFGFPGPGGRRAPRRA